MHHTAMARCRKLPSPPLCPLPHPARGRRELVGARPQAAAPQPAPCAPSLPDAAPQGASRCGRADMNRYSAAVVGCISLHVGTAELAYCYGSMQEVTKPSLMPPAPPSERPQGVGWCTSASGRTPASSLRPLAPRQPPGASRCGRAVWQEAVAALRSGHNLMPNGTAELASCYGSICAKITLSAGADNHYFREICLFAMVRCSLLSSCYGSVRPCALPLPRKSVKAAAALCSGRTLAAFSGGIRPQPTPHPYFTPYGSLLAACFLLWLGATLRPAAPPEKRQGRGRTLQRPHPCRFFGGHQAAAHPPPRRYPLWLAA